MRILGTGILSQRAFTLLELVVVLFIVSLALAIAYPTVNLLKDARKSDAKRFASLLRNLNDSAINRKETYEMTVDLEEKGVSWDTDEGKKQGEFKSLEGLYVTSRGTVKSGTLTIFFGPLGFQEILRASFRGDEEVYMVSYNPYSRRVKIE